MIEILDRDSIYVSAPLDEVDVGRVLEIPFNRCDQLAKLVPEDQYLLHFHAIQPLRELIDLSTTSLDEFYERLREKIEASEAASFSPLASARPETERT